MKEKRYVAVICEYNPFHFGHLHQIKRLKEEFDGVACIMSGNLVQRGSVAVADKYLRAEAAIKNGADLVVELPFPWCSSSAKDFARAGVQIASDLGVSHLAFGAENSLEELYKINALVSEKGFAEKLKTLVETNKNLSYPQGLKTLVSQRFGEEYADICEKPNNILGLEYISSLEGKNITPFVVKRESKFESSSTVRALEIGEKIIAQLPMESALVFGRELGKDFPRNMRKLDSFFIGTLRRMSGESNCEVYYSTPYDLFKKIVSTAVKVNSVEDLVSQCTDKIYTSARVRRALLSMVFGVTPDRVACAPTYTCVLGMNSVGREILRFAKKQAKIEIITKPVRANVASKETAESFAFSKSVEDIISLSAPSPIASDVGKSPYVE